MNPTSIRLPDDLAEQVAEAAKNSGKSRSDFIVGVLEQYFKKPMDVLLTGKEFAAFSKTLRKVCLETESIRQQFIKMQHYFDELRQEQGLKADPERTVHS